MRFANNSDRGNTGNLFYDLSPQSQRYIHIHIYVYIYTHIKKYK